VIETHNLGREIATNCCWGRHDFHVLQARGIGVSKSLVEDQLELAEVFGVGEKERLALTYCIRVVVADKFAAECECPNSQY